MRAHGRLLLAGSLAVDVALLVFVHHHFASVAAVEVAGSVFALVTVVTAFLTGVLAGLAVGLFTGTVFYLFVAPDATASEKTTSLLAVLLWNVAAVLVGLFAEGLVSRVGHLTTGGLPGRHLVVLPLPNDSAIEMRDALRALLADHGVDATVREQVVLAAQEAYNNAVVQPPGTVEVSAKLRRGTIVVEIRDQGHGFDLTPYLAGGLPDPLSTSGRGLFLMHELVDKVEVEASPEGCVVRLSKQVRAMSSASASGGRSTPRS